MPALDISETLEALNALPGCCVCEKPKSMIPIMQRYWGAVERLLWCENCAPAHVLDAIHRRSHPFDGIGSVKRARRRR